LQISAVIGDATLAWGNGHFRYASLRSQLLEASSIVGRRTGSVDRIINYTEKPLVLLESILTSLTSEGDSVCDCLSGSGSMLAACAALGRNCDGFEKDPTQIRSYEGRLINARDRAVAAIVKPHTIPLHGLTLSVGTHTSPRIRTIEESVGFTYSPVARHWVLKKYFLRHWVRLY
jgi:hypothetical protein